MRSKHLKTKFKINGIDIPVKIYIERRSNSRVSFGKRGIIIRLPYGMSQSEMHKHIANYERWATKTLAKNKNLSKAYEEKNYFDGQTFEINNKIYTLRIIYSERKSYSAKLLGDEIQIKSPINKSYQSSDVIKKLLSRIIALDNQKEVYDRIQELNKRFFNKQINQVKLKYNHSNWGSCSTKGNINISTRLLFAPKDVQDYVFIHELSHMIEQNHSTAFWAIIKNILPDYKEKEKWLKVNNAICDF